jgi:hypothetical protein
MNSGAITKRERGIRLTIRPVFAIIGSAKNHCRSCATEIPLRFVLCGRFATLCRFSQHWVTLGDLGSNWVNIGGRGRG